MPLPSKSKSPSSKPYNTLPRLFRRNNSPTKLRKYKSDSGHIKSPASENILSVPNQSIVGSISKLTNLFRSRSLSILVSESEEENKIEYSIMANPGTSSQPQVTTIDIFNSLRVPDAIKDLPRFEGNPRLLFDFLGNVDEILSLIDVTNGTPYGKLLLRAIRNKIVGEANEVLNMYGTPLDWNLIKTNLTLHYADKRNETSLIRDLHVLKQNNDSVQKFYSEIIEILSSMNNHVCIHESDLNVISAKKSLFAEMCLNTFLSGLKEPLGSTVRAMKPTTLAEAYACCIQEQNILYTKSDSNRSLLNPRSVNPLKPIMFPQQNKDVFKPKLLFPLIPPQGFSNPPFNQQYRPNFLPQQKPFGMYQQPQNPFVRQQQFRPPQYPQQFQRQAPFQNNYPHFQQRASIPNRPSNGPVSKPEPMEIGSGTIRRNHPQQREPGSNFFRSTGPANFTSKELFNVGEQESNSHSKTQKESLLNINSEEGNPTSVPYNLEQYYSQYYYDDEDVYFLNPYENCNQNNSEENNIDEENFPTNASSTQSDT